VSGVRPTFYFDLGSPYAWLAAERVDRVLPVAPEWQPVSLGALFKIKGRGSWAHTDARAQGMAEVERRAAERGLGPVRWPDPWPGHMLSAMRGAVVARRMGLEREYALTAFRHAFLEGRDLSDPGAVVGAAAGAGLDPDAVLRDLRAQDVKDELRLATEAAADRGVVGVPTVVVDGELFWGDDRLEDAARALEQSA
jgi:2-hydroxychromene-2-carboxylate isomerase